MARVNLTGKLCRVIAVRNNNRDHDLLKNFKVKSILTISAQIERKVKIDWDIVTGKIARGEKIRRIAGG